MRRENGWGGGGQGDTVKGWAKENNRTWLEFEGGGGFKGK